MFDVACKEIHRIDHDVFPIMKVEPQSLPTANTGEAHIQRKYEALSKMIDDAFARPKALQDSYSRYGILLMIL